MFHSPYSTPTYEIPPDAGSRPAARADTSTDAGAAGRQCHIRHARSGRGADRRTPLRRGRHRHAQRARTHPHAAGREGRDEVPRHAARRGDHLGARCGPLRARRRERREHLLRQRLARGEPRTPHGHPLDLRPVRTGSLGALQKRLPGPLQRVAGGLCRFAADARTRFALPRRGGPRTALVGSAAARFRTRRDGSGRLRTALLSAAAHAALQPNRRRERHSGLLVRRRYGRPARAAGPALELRRLRALLRRPPPHRPRRLPAPVADRIGQRALQPPHRRKPPEPAGRLSGTAQRRRFGAAGNDRLRQRRALRHGGRRIRPPDRHRIVGALRRRGVRIPASTAEERTPNTVCGAAGSPPGAASPANCMRKAASTSSITTATAATRAARRA